jgi:hypothetical protein
MPILPFSDNKNIGYYSSRMCGRVINTRKNRPIKPNPQLAKIEDIADGQK